MSINSITLLSLTDQTNYIDGKKCTLFAVRLQSDAKEWCTVKQLEDFHLLLNTLRLTVTDCKLKLPTKNMFDPSFGRKRLKQLKAFINELITDPRYLEQDCVKKFLGLDQLCPPGLPLTAQVDTETTEAKRAIPEDFVLVKKIGMGAFGQVYLANSRTTNGVFAIKVLKKKQQIERPSGVQQVMSERNVLIKSLQHPFLCKLRYTFQSASMLFFVMDYVNGGELYSYIQRERFTEERAKFYVAEIACALGYLHSEKIIYRDLKPENILLDGQGHIVLTDFGLCTDADGVEETGTVCGTPEYLAPESIRAGEYSYAVDWWGLGTVFYEMLYGLPPFFDTNRRKMHEAILMKPVKLGDNISEEAKQLILGFERSPFLMRFDSLFRSVYTCAMLECVQQSLMKSRHCTQLPHQTSGVQVSVWPRTCNAGDLYVKGRWSPLVVDHLAVGLFSKIDNQLTQLTYRYFDISLKSSPTYPPLTTVNKGSKTTQTRLKWIRITH